MKRKCLFPFLLLFTCFVFSSTSWAGGVVQEFKVSNDDGVGKTSRALTAQCKHYHELASKEKPVATPPMPPLPNTFKVTYDKATNAMILAWKPLKNNGMLAIRYNIYRWTMHDAQVPLLAKVNGKIFQYIDVNFNATQTYFYKVVGVFRNSDTNGLYTKVQYPVQELNPSHGGESINAPAPQQERQATEPPQGLGCSMNTNGSAPLSGLFLLMFLLLLPFFRRSDHLS